MSVLVVQSCNVVDAASQGKLGAQSSASVEISVTVHQSLSVVSPIELLLNDSSKTKSTASKPFCIAHSGINDNTSVPYDLVVDSLTQNENSNTHLYNIYLKDKDKSKMLLSEGTSITKQSLSSNNGQVTNECSHMSAELLIEKNTSVENIRKTTGTTDLLILLVRPH